MPPVVLASVDSVTVISRPRGQGESGRKVAVLFSQLNAPEEAGRVYAAQVQ